MNKQEFKKIITGKESVMNKASQIILVILLVLLALIGGTVLKYKVSGIAEGTFVFLVFSFFVGMVVFALISSHSQKRRLIKEYENISSPTWEVYHEILQEAYTEINISGFLEQYYWYRASGNLYKFLELKLNNHYLYDLVNHDCWTSAEKVVLIYAANLKAESMANNFKILKTEEDIEFRNRLIKEFC